MAANISGEASLSMVFCELLTVVNTARKTHLLGAELLRLKSTIECMIPSVKEVDLKFPEIDTDKFKQGMFQGIELIHKCSIVRFCPFQIDKYADKLNELNQFIGTFRDWVMSAILYKSSEKSGSADKNDKLISSERDDGHALGDDSNKLFTDLNRLVDGGADGHRVGKLSVKNTLIAKGSNGTIVLEGIYEGRPVAVKRLVRAYHNVAFREIQNLISSDGHPNIVRLYGVENDRDFFYLSLEHCTCSLDDLIQICSDSSHNSSSFDEGQTTKTMSEFKLPLDSVKSIMQDLNLWKPNGHPSPLLLKLMRDIVSGLVHLHELRIIHRDLKPANVLIIKERSLCAKLSDMGISKHLPVDMSSLSHATGCGSSGWQAPEQLRHGHQTRAVDLFSLGCVLYFCITNGKHPFGERLERDINIVSNNVNLSLVKKIPEAEDLISRLLNTDPQLRPSAFEVFHHPLFWSSETRLSFLRDTSDRIESETSSALLQALESTASVALGTKWDEKMKQKFIDHMRRYRHYRSDSVKDLLRFVRNTLNHYRELPRKFQKLVGPVPEKLNEYFARRFPRLLIEVYKVVCRYCREEECYQKYFKSDILSHFSSM